MKKVLTLAYLIDNERVCLGYKKRGFGEGNWNGYGVRKCGALSQEVVSKSFLTALG